MMSIGRREHLCLCALLLCFGCASGGGSQEVNPAADGAAPDTSGGSGVAAGAGSPTSANPGGGAAVVAASVDTSGWALLPVLASSVTTKDGQCILKVTTRTPTSGWKVQIRLASGAGSDPASIWREYEIVGQPPARPPSGGKPTTQTTSYSEILPKDVQSLIIRGEGESSNVLEVPETKAEGS